ncbi:hypothetical protein IP92_04450 [Pseudoduganella flava]|nr:hypothetical protein IP92_04450 [Pseudoduganella flava]
MLDDPATLGDPARLFPAAIGVRTAGDKEQAGFLYLLARLRASRQALLEQGDAAQVVSVMTMTAAPLILPELAADPALARRVVDRVLAWDKARPDPFRERALARGGEAAANIAKLEASLAGLPDQVGTRLSPDTLRTRLAQAEQEVARIRHSQCQAGTLDAADLAAARSRIERDAAQLAAKHPLVQRQVDGPVRTVRVGATELGPSQLPRRLTLVVEGNSGKRTYAEVDVAPVVDAQRRFESARVALACVTGQWLGQREALKDVCVSDPQAVKPAEGER